MRTDEKTPHDEPNEVAWRLIEGYLFVIVTVPITMCIRYNTTNVPTSWIVHARNPEARESSPDQPTLGTHWNESTKPDGTKTHKVHVDSLSSSSSSKELVDALVRLDVLQAFQFRDR